MDDFKDKGTISPSGWGKRSTVEHLPYMQKALAPPLGPQKKKRRRGNGVGGEGRGKGRRVHGDPYFKKKK